MVSSNVVSLKEQKQIVNDLFLGYLSKININSLTWDYEGSKNKIPSLTFKQLSLASKSSQTIGGGYQGELPFLINYVVEKDSNTKLDASNPLNQLAIMFENETNNNLPNLKIDNIKPLSLHQATTPELTIDKDNNIAKYSATYMLRYKTKGWY